MPLFGKWSYFWLYFGEITVVLYLFVDDVNHSFVDDVTADFTLAARSSTE